MAVALGDRLQLRARAVAIDIALPLVDVLELLEVPLQELRVMVPVADPAASGEGLRVLKFGGPDRTVRPSVRMGVEVDHRERQRGPSILVAVARNLVRTPVPPGIHPLVAGLPHQMTVRVVGEDVPGVVEDDVKDHPKP